jgi:hypothetical protein
MTDLTVRRVQDEHGSHIEPPLGQSWDNSTKLEWHAAVVALDTGLDIEIGPGALRVMRRGIWHAEPDTYSVNIMAGGGTTTSCSALNYHEAWIYLNGVRAGVWATAPTWSGAAEEAEIP